MTYGFRVCFIDGTAVSFGEHHTVSFQDGWLFVEGGVVSPALEAVYSSSYVAKVVYNS